jgi:hypothetical protein
MLSDDIKKYKRESAKHGNCSSCICKTCANLANVSVQCGNTEYYCKNLCSGEFEKIEKCASYSPKTKNRSA